MHACTCTTRACTHVSLRSWPPSPFLRIVDDYSFTAADQPEGTRIEIGVEYVREKIKPLIKDADLSKYVL